MTSKLPLAAAALAVAGVAAVGLSSAGAPDSAAGTAALADAPAPAEAGVVQVWKSPTCGCCGAWVDHMRAEGFEVEVHDMADLRGLKAEHGVTDDLASCHTALVDGYVVEGHVPASDVRRLLAERPEIAGIAAPGMPVGSPGMEVPGRAPDPYEVVAFTRDGGRSVFARH